MANLTTGRDTRSKDIVRSISIPVKAATVIQDGSIVCVIGGYAAPAVDGAGNIVMGIADWKVDNSAGANGDKSIRVRQGVFHLDNANCVAADVGKTVYPSDDHTANHTAGANTVALGQFLELDPDGGAWVRVP